jgi:hypothetical protein
MELKYWEEEGSITPYLRSCSHGNCILRGDNLYIGVPELYVMVKWMGGTQFRSQHFSEIGGNSV